MRYKLAISGGHCTGKTTLARALSKRLDWEASPEFARIAAASPVTWSPRSAALRDVVAIEYLDGSRELIGQTPRERPRPDAPPERPSGATVEKGRLAVMKCDECGNELEYTWMHVGRHSYHVGRCARCAPPLTIE